MCTRTKFYRRSADSKPIPQCETTHRLANTVENEIQENNMEVTPDEWRQETRVLVSVVMRITILIYVYVAAICFCCDTIAQVCDQRYLRREPWP